MAPLSKLIYQDKLVSTLLSCNDFTDVLYYTHTFSFCRGGSYCVKLSVQVPYETLNKRFRAAQKNIDRETSHVTMVVAELEKTLSSFPVVDSVVSLLDGVVEKLSALKRKVRRTNVQTHAALLSSLLGSIHIIWNVLLYVKL